MARQVERREATRAALIAAARASLLDVGHEATSTEAVLARAGVSRGALYHHFPSKTDLVAAVFETVSCELVDQAETAAGGARTAREAVAISRKTWLRRVMEPDAFRIILDIGPAVLGLARARQIEDGITQAPLRQTLARAVERGETGAIDIDLVSRLLSAAAGELALAAAERGLKAAELPAFEAQLDAFVAALVPPR
jgi:AcrR family transcriptional regulator